MEHIFEKKIQEVAACQGGVMESGNMGRGAVVEVEENPFAILVKCHCHSS